MIKIHRRLLSAGTVFLSPRLVSFCCRGGKGRTHPPAGDRNRSSRKPGQTSEKKQPDALSGNSSRRYHSRYGFLRLYGKRLCCGRIKEEENEKFHVFHVKGKGSFSQITAAFGIIKSKERWSAAELCALKREGNLLAYEVEVRAVRNRGMYEKEKYSPDRAYGDGKEPGGQNTRRRL